MPLGIDVAETGLWRKCPVCQNPRDIRQDYAQFHNNRTQCVHIVVLWAFRPTFAEIAEKWPDSGVHVAQ